MTNSLKSKAGGPKKRPTRYTSEATNESLNRALRLHRKQALALAEEEYQAALECDPASVDAWMNLGTLLVRRGRAKDAGEAFTRALELAPNDPRAHRDAAIGMTAVGEFASARKMFERALTLAPSLTGARLCLSRLLAEMGERDLAIYHATQAIAHSPLSPSAHLEFHRAIFDDGNLGPAISAATRALELNGDYALARFFLSAALTWEFRSEEATQSLGLDGLVNPGLGDVIQYCSHYRTTARTFATKRETLLYANASAKGSGPILEFGVRHGISTRVLTALNAGMVHAFDSFEGLPIQWRRTPAGSFTTQGEAPPLVPNVTYHVGLFEDTLPNFIKTLDAPPRLVHVDSDLYESAATVLRELGPHLRAGSVLVFDEFIGNAHWRDDEFKAFQEAVARYGWRYEMLALCWVTGQSCVRLLG